jgi:hypothetical protein
MSIRHILLALLFAAITTSSAPASQIAFDNIGSSPSYTLGNVAFSAYLNLGLGGDYGVVGFRYQPTQHETLQNFAAAFGATRADNQPPIFPGLDWKMSIWQVPAGSPAVGGLPAIVDEFINNPLGGGGTHTTPIAPPLQVGTFAASGRPKFYAEFDVSSSGITLDPQFEYMFALGVDILPLTETAVFIVESTNAGQTGLHAFSDGTTPQWTYLDQKPSHQNFGVPAYRLTVNPVPEPASWLILAIGGGAMGIAWLRRRR